MNNEGYEILYDFMFTQMQYQFSNIHIIPVSVKLSCKKFAFINNVCQRELAFYCSLSFFCVSSFNLYSLGAICREFESFKYIMILHSWLQQ